MLKTSEIFLGNLGVFVDVYIQLLLPTIETCGFVLNSPLFIESLLLIYVHFVSVLGRRNQWRIKIVQNSYDFAKKVF